MGISYNQGTSGTRTVAYDARGNVTTLGNLGFIYDRSDQPVAVSGTANGVGSANGNYVYDGNLKRVKSVVNGATIYNVYDAGGALAYVHKLPFAGQPEKKVDYIRAAGMNVARVVTGVSITYLHPDHLGSAQTGTGSSGTAAVFRERYTPFGEEIIGSAANDNLGGFTGHIKDKATGLNYMQARYYDPVIGRFLSIDPVTMMDTGEPSQFNRYAYTWNDPINGIDPNGEYREAVWTSANTVEVRIPVAVRDKHGIGSYNSQDLANEVSSRFSGTTTINGVSVTVTTTGVAVAPNAKGKYPKNTNVQKVKKGNGTARATLGGTKSKVYASDSVMIGTHEIGHNAGAKDQYSEGKDAAGNRATTANKGFDNTIGRCQRKCAL